MEGKKAIEEKKLMMLKKKPPSANLKKAPPGSPSLNPLSSGGVKQAGTNLSSTSLIRATAASPEVSAVKEPLKKIASLPPPMPKTPRLPPSRAVGVTPEPLTTETKLGKSEVPSLPKGLPTLRAVADSKEPLKENTVLTPAVLQEFVNPTTASLPPSTPEKTKAELTPVMVSSSSPAKATTAQPSGIKSSQDVAALPNSICTKQQPEGIPEHTLPALVSANVESTLKEDTPTPQIKESLAVRLLRDETFGHSPNKIKLPDSTEMYVPLERRKTYNLTAALSTQPQTEVYMQSVPQALISGVVESLELSKELKSTLSRRQEEVLGLAEPQHHHMGQYFYAAPGNHPASTPRRMSMDSSDGKGLPGNYYVLYSPSGRPLSRVGPPPRALIDPCPIDPLPTAWSERQPSHIGSMTLSHKKDFYHNRGRATSNLSALAATDRGASLQVLEPKHYPEGSPGGCPTCGVNPNIMLHSNYSQYQLPRDPQDLSQKKTYSRHSSWSRGSGNAAETSDLRRTDRLVPPQVRYEQPTAFSPSFREPHHPDYNFHVGGGSPWRDVEHRIHLARSKKQGFKHYPYYADEGGASVATSGPPTPRSYVFGPVYRRGAERWEAEHPTSITRPASAHGRQRTLRQRLPGPATKSPGKVTTIQQHNRESHLGRGTRQIFEGGLTTYRRSPYRSLSEMATYYTQLEVEDQADVISLLLACRKLEKQIEEQHIVIDMLDHDLRQAQQTLQFPPEWKSFEQLDLKGQPIPDAMQLPDSQLPVYLRGRVLLQQEAPVHPGATHFLGPAISETSPFASLQGDAKPQATQAKPKAGTGGMKTTTPVVKPVMKPPTAPVKHVGRGVPTGVPKPTTAAIGQDKVGLSSKRATATGGKPGVKTKSTAGLTSTPSKKPVEAGPVPTLKVTPPDGSKGASASSASKKLPSGLGASKGSTPALGLKKPSFPLKKT